MSVSKKVGAEIGQFGAIAKALFSNGEHLNWQAA
jgi:hypothetical protein